MPTEEELQNIIDNAILQSGEGGIEYTTTTTTDLPSWFDGFSAGLTSGWSWIIFLIMVASQWVIFTKAKQPGWAAIVPIYGTLVFLQVVNRPWWWIFLFFIPIVGLVYGIMATHQLSKAFGKEAGFTFGLVLLPFIFYPILAFSGDKYKKPV